MLSRNQVVKRCYCVITVGLSSWDILEPYHLIIAIVWSVNSVNVVDEPMLEVRSDDVANDLYLNVVNVCDDEDDSDDDSDAVV